MQGAAQAGVYRPVLSRVLAAVYLAIAVYWLGAVLLGPRPGDALVVGPALLAVGALVYALLWRPAVVVDLEGVRLVNLVRDVRVPWPALEGVETRYALTLLTAGRSYQSWAAAAAGRPQRSVLLGRRDEAAERVHHRLPDPRWQPSALTSDRASRDLGTDSGAAAFLVEQAWAAWRERPVAERSATTDEAPEPAPVSVRWNLPLVAAIVLPAVFAVVAALVRS